MNQVHGKSIISSGGCPAPAISHRVELESGSHEDGQMKRSRFRQEQIMGVLRMHEAGGKTSDLARARDFGGDAV